MTSDFDDHRAGILEYPEDDTRRLVFADMLEDSGVEDNVNYAEFIRCQIAREHEKPRSPRWDELNKRQAALLHQTTTGQWSKVPNLMAGHWVFKRGFVAMIAIPETSIIFIPEVLKVQPVEFIHVGMLQDNPITITKPPDKFGHWRVGFEPSSAQVQIYGGRLPEYYTSRAFMIFGISKWLEQALRPGAGPQNRMTGYTQRQRERREQPSFRVSDRSAMLTRGMPVRTDEQNRAVQCAEDDPMREGHVVDCSDPSEMLYAICTIRLDRRETVWSFSIDIRMAYDESEYRRIVRDTAQQMAAAWFTSFGGNRRYEPQVTVEYDNWSGCVRILMRSVLGRDGAAHYDELTERFTQMILRVSLSQNRTYPHRRRTP